MENKNEFSIDKLEKMVEEGLATKRIGENTVYFIEDGEVVKKKIENCVTYETTSKGFICWK
jgi:hypothetical protein